MAMRVHSADWIIYGSYPNQGTTIRAIGAMKMSTPATTDNFVIVNFDTRRGQTI